MPLRVLRRQCGVQNKQRFLNNVVEGDHLRGVAAMLSMDVLSWDAKASLTVRVLWQIGQTQLLGNHSVVPTMSFAGEQPKYTLVIVRMDRSTIGI